MGREDQKLNRPAKRRKIAIACDDCRTRKVRCDGVQPGMFQTGRNLTRADSTRYQYVGRAPNGLDAKCSVCILASTRRSELYRRQSRCFGNLSRPTDLANLPIDTLPIWKIDSRSSRVPDQARAEKSPLIVPEGVPNQATRPFVPSPTLLEL